MNIRRPRSKKKAGGCLVLVAVIAGIALFGQLVQDLVDTPFNPWAHSWRGGPTLTGMWIGSVTSPTGQRSVLFLDLQRARTGRRNRRYSMCRTCPRIEGAARTCGGGDAQAYEVWGGPDTWGGERFHLRTAPPATEHNAPRLGYLNGEWAGDALSLTITGGDEAGAGGDVSDAGRQMRAEMRRGGEADFLALCQKPGAD